MSSEQSTHYVVMNPHKQEFLESLLSFWVYSHMLGLWEPLTKEVTGRVLAETGFAPLCFLLIPLNSCPLVQVGEERLAVTLIAPKCTSAPWSPCLQWDGLCLRFAVEPVERGLLYILLCYIPIVNVGYVLQPQIL